MLFTLETDPQPPPTVGVAATANNPSKSTFANVDVFGRVFDSQGQNALDRVRCCSRGG